MAILPEDPTIDTLGADIVARTDDEAPRLRLAAVLKAAGYLREAVAVAGEDGQTMAELAAAHGIRLRPLLELWTGVPEGQARNEHTVAVVAFVSRYRQIMTRRINGVAIAEQIAGSVNTMCRHLSVIAEKADAAMVDEDDRDQVNAGHVAIIRETKRIYELLCGLLDPLWLDGYTPSDT